MDLKFGVMHRCFVAIVSLVLVSSAFAHPPQAYVNSGGMLVVNGQEYSRNFFTAGYNLGESMADNPEAYELYLKHARYSMWFAALNWGSVAAALTYAGVTPIEDFSLGTYMTVFLVPFIGGLIAQTASQAALVQSINVYNGIPPSQAQIQFENNSHDHLACQELALLSWKWSF